jgi:pSer/pThr/pTyr-binding forkhead associated (FHA) protein
MTNFRISVTHLSGLRQGEREVLSSLPIIIGRAPGSHLRLAANDTRASAKHAELYLENNRLYIRDLNSTNGTYISGKRVEATRLVNGDIVEFGTDGPKLRFEFEQKEAKEVVAETAIDNAANKVAPPPLALQPASGPGSGQSNGPAARPQFGIANQAGQELAVSPPANVNPSPTPRALSPMAIEEREYPFRNRFKYILYSSGLMLLGLAVFLFIQQILIWTVPAGLIGLFLLTMGLSCSRINITANNQGIHYQGILRSTLIRWEDITELRVFRSRTRLLTDLVYAVHSRNNSIVFAAEDYKDGLDLANLIARRTRQSW